MEAIINGVVIGFTFLVIIIVEMVMGKRPLTKKEVSDYQKILNKMDADAKDNYNLVWKHDAAFELMKQRKQNKSFVLIFSGMLLALSCIILAYLTTFLSLLNIGSACTSGIILICYGLAKITGSKKLTIGVLLFIFILGTVAMFAFDKLMVRSLFAHAYFCGLILALGVFSFINNARQPKQIKASQDQSRSTGDKRVIFDSEPFKLAAEKFKTLGSLGVISEDHRTIGSTPPKKLLENPGKTLGELMSDQEIVDWIEGNEKAINEFSGADQNDSFVKSALPMLKEDLELGKKYLKSIGKL